MKNLSSSLPDYDALIIVATQLDEIKGFVDSSVVENLQSFSQVTKFLENKSLVLSFVS